MKKTALKLSLLAVLGLSSALLSGCIGMAVVGAGTTAIMLEDRRTTGMYIEDENIEWKALPKINEVTKDGHVNATCFNGLVLLTGEVANEETKVKLAEAITRIASVKNVANEVRVAGNSSLAARGNDSLLTTRVKTSFIGNGKFSPNHVKVITEAGTVFLMGLVTNREGDAAAEIARNTSGVANVVKIFEYLP